MTVKIDLNGVTDLLDYLENSWVANYSYNSHGFFAGPGASNDYSQWGAGNAGTSQSAVLLNGDFDYGAPGGFNGDIDSLVFGNNLAGSGSGYTIDASVSFDLSGATTSGSFNYAIYYMSNTGNLNTFYDYLGEQGTEQTSSSADEVFYGFDGVDTFVFDGGWGDDSIDGFADGQDLIDLSGLGFSDFADFTANGGAVDNVNDVISYNDGSTTSTISLVGFTGTIDASDFIFV
ncbi:hemolysin [Stappia sp.]|jgi:hypothetical protein|uniref:hemolysin n=1 Tax=Stappia sp. TaxID=1870903 RepID=UPI003A991A98